MQVGTLTVQLCKQVGAYRQPLHCQAGPLQCVGDDKICAWHRSHQYANLCTNLMVQLKEVMPGRQAQLSVVTLRNAELFAASPALTELRSLPV